MGSGMVTHSLFESFDSILESNFQKNPFNSFTNLTEYQKYHWMPIIFKLTFDYNAFPLLSNINNYEQLFIYDLNLNNNINFIYNDLFLDSYRFYPRKIGFYPKKIAM